MAVKISIIGAGSAVFSLALIRDLCLTPNLNGSTVSFMDIDPERLDAAYTLCKRYAEEVGSELTLEQTMNRHESLQGADFVVNTALAAGYERLRAGWDVAREHGYRMGGSLHILHDEAFWINFYQFRLFGSLLQDILTICPDAWYLQVDNPVFAGITYISRRYPQAKVVGLCHGFRGVNAIADALGLERDSITYEIPGVNHFVWLNHLYHKGEDALPRLQHWAETEAEPVWKNQCPSSLLGPKPVDMYKRFGVFPIGDTANPGGGAWGWWYHTDDETEKRWQEDPEGWYARHFASVDRSVESVRAAAYDSSHKVSEAFPPRLSGEIMIPMIESITCDIPRVLVSNIANSGGYVPGVPHNVAVEIPALVSKRGIQGVQTSPLPQGVLAYLLRDRVAPVEVELEAYQTGSHERLLQLIMLDPRTRSESQARSLLNAILDLPFHADLREYYQ